MGLGKLTSLIMALSPFVFGGIDYAAYKIGGNDTTFSRKLLYSSFRYPLVPIFICYSMGVFIRHCFIPKFTSEIPTTPDVLGRMCIILSPSFYVMAIVLADDGTSNANQRVILYGGWWALAFYMLLAFAVGMVAGRWLPQHLDPEGPLMQEDPNNPIVHQGT